MQQIGMDGKTLTIIGIFFFVGGWMVKNLFGIQFLCQGTHGMFCRILFISQLLMYVCNEECQEKISPIQSYFNILDNSFELFFNISCSRLFCISAVKLYKRTRPCKRWPCFTV